VGQQDHPAARGKAEHRFVFGDAFDRQAKVGPEPGVLRQIIDAEQDGFHAQDAHTNLPRVCALMMECKLGEKRIASDGYYRFY
jgi:hypothetical protein